MTLPPRKRNRLGANLSANIDGELDDECAAELSKELRFDDRLQQQRCNLEQIAFLTNAALTSSHRVDSRRSADQILRAIDMTPSARTHSRIQSLLRPAVLASVGLLVTAGLALAGMRRGGLIRR